MMNLMNVEPVFWIGIGAVAAVICPDAGSLLDPGTEDAEEWMKEGLLRMQQPLLFTLTPIPPCSLLCYNKPVCRSDDLTI